MNNFFSNIDLIYLEEFATLYPPAQSDGEKGATWWTVSRNVTARATERMSLDGARWRYIRLLLGR
jgi:hypothetical protein